jgi:hypothetical protein
MDIKLHSFIFSAVGALLVLFGALRAGYLGLRRRRRDLAEDTPARQKQRRYHLVVGIVWVAMGAFLILSTAFQLSLKLKH